MKPSDGAGLQGIGFGLGGLLRRAFLPAKKSALQSCSLCPNYFSASANWRIRQICPREGRRNVCPFQPPRATSNRAVGKVILQMGAVVFPAEQSFCKWELSFCKWEQSFCKWEQSFCKWELSFCKWELSFCKWEQSFFRRKSHFVNVSSHFSGGKVVLQICRPPHKLAKPFFRRRNRFTNGSRRFSGGEIALQIGAVIFPAEKSFCKWEQSFFRRKSHLANLQNDRSYVKNP